MNLGQAVGLRTLELLQQKGVSQYRLTRLAGFNDKTIPDLVNGRTNNVKVVTVFRIAEALGVSMSTFMRSPLFNKKNIDVE